MISTSRLAESPETLRIMHQAARQAAMRFPWLREEFESAAGLAVVLAARRFDPSRGVPWQAYLSRRLQGAMIDVLRAECPAGFRGRSRSRDRDQDQVETGWTTLSLSALSDDATDFDVPDERYEVGWEIERLDTIEAATKQLPETERRAIRTLCSRAGATQAAISRELGLSPSRVSQLVSNGKRRINEGG